MDTTRRIVLASVLFGAALTATARADADRSLLAQAAPSAAAPAPAGAVARDVIREEGKKFLAENARREGVVVLASGVQYEVLKKGEGAPPGPRDVIRARYRGTLIDGRHFGSSPGDAPERLEVAALMPGLAEAVQHMSPGAHWKIYIPPHRGFGQRSPLEDRVVIYDVTLDSVEPASTTP